MSARGRTAPATVRERLRGSRPQPPLTGLTERSSRQGQSRSRALTQRVPGHAALPSCSRRIREGYADGAATFVLCAAMIFHCAPLDDQRHQCGARLSTHPVIAAQLGTHVGDHHVWTQATGVFHPGAEGGGLKRTRVSGGVDLFDLAAAAQAAARYVDKDSVVKEHAREGVHVVLVPRRGQAGRDVTGDAASCAVATARAYRLPSCSRYRTQTRLADGLLHRARDLREVDEQPIRAAQVQVRLVAEAVGVQFGRDHAPAELADRDGGFQPG